MANNYGQTVQALGLGGGAEAQSSTTINITDERGPWLVTLLPIRGVNGAAVPAASFDFRARVEWAAGGVRHKAEIDWPLNGATFVVSCTALTVIGVFNPGAVLTGTPPQTLTVQFSAFASRCDGPRANAAPPRRTIVYGALPAATVVARDVPQHARKVRFGATTTVATRLAAGDVLDLRLDWRDQAGAVGPGLVQFFADVAVPIFYGVDFLSLQVPVIVPREALTVRLDNQGTLAFLNCRLIYDLDIG